MDYKTLTYFLEISECKTLSAAGRTLHVSKSTLSRYLRQLEASLGISLFEYRNTGLELTPAGAAYAQGARRILDLLEKNTAELDVLHRTQTAFPPPVRIRLGLTPSGAFFLTELYPLLIRTYPELRIDLTEGYALQLLEKLRTRKLDMLLGIYHPQALHGLTAAHFYQSELFLIIPAYHPIAPSGGSNFASAGTITPEQIRKLQDLPFLSTSFESVVGSQIRQNLDRMQFHPASLLQAKSYSFILSLLKTGLYGGFSFYNAELESADVVFFHLPSPIYFYTSAVFAPQHTITSSEQALCALHFRSFALKTGFTPAPNLLASQLLADAETERSKS